MKWNKLGLVFDLRKEKPDWVKSHAMTPTPLLLKDKIRVYFTGRSQKGESMISYVDLDRKDPSKILYIKKEPVMEIGGIGMFDDCGTICTCAIQENNEIYLYYTAYSVSFKVPYKNAVGLGVSKDNGDTFLRKYDGPILDRSKFEPFFVISPWVMHFNNTWHMWYASATDWVLVDNKPESVYHIKYAHSKNGLDWERDNITCIEPLTKEEANARPTVIHENGKLKMWFTYRGSRDFRDGPESYRIGYAEAVEQSPTKWSRMDDKSGLEIGETNYDNLMQAYPAVVKDGDRKILFYNGNGFGVNGFCVAIANE
ncbi:hypothetical protein HZR84_01025 [Hyphobacterium sp. CCMP332]|nr:hypothetical protein HZR84_01025 [Hyphobacterium sp. CCMP332]